MSIMPITLSSPSAADLPEMSALCLRSKAYWGYDAVFMAACRDELTLTDHDIETSALTAAWRDGGLAGVAQVKPEESGAEIWKLFVDPPHMGTGVGRQLFDWCVAEARKLDAAELRIEADPEAVPFYQRMGARMAGSAPSGSIPGRRLPLLRYALR
ncbi:GNAT family N-acetyltransferase [Roseovarius indicus]|uniref:GNAT family N-acetyltransferase n=1 Tax=Roseovarius indicus TaxID=540747 RepID=UPI0032EC7890